MHTIDLDDLAAVTGGTIMPRQPETPMAPGGKLGDLAKVQRPVDAVPGNLGDIAKAEKLPLDSIPRLSDLIKKGGGDWYPTGR